jgi:D-alanyl-D-alanine carboxypeptidase/D-alanyl-D-alanine-endopeptidase (penicillin-binding protein 4)
MLIRRCAAALCLLLLPLSLHAQRADTLHRDVRTILQRPGAPQRAYWGIEVVDAQTGASIARYNADRLFIPASNLKLVVAATAAHHLPADFRYRTTLHATGPIEDGVLRGDLVIYGRGDPAISGRYADGNIVAVWEALADSLATRGIRRIEGRVVADESYWDTQYVLGDWESYDLLWWYAAPVAALGFNDNSIDFTVAPGTVGRPAAITFKPESRHFVFVNRSVTVAAGRPGTIDFDRVPGTDTIFAYGNIPADAARGTENFAVADPARYAATVFAETLQKKSIAIASVEPRVLRDTAASRVALQNARVIVTHQSPPLPQIIGPILQSSQNWFAEQLLKTVGREVGGEGSWPKGLEVERRFLVDVVRIDSTSFRLRDASGLSAHNLITPRAFTSLLVHIGRTANMREVMNALPVAGAATGSLRARLPELRGRVAAKTGSIGNVDSLSGFVTTDSGRRLAFSIIVNNTGTTSSAMRPVIDDIVRAIARVY